MLKELEKIEHRLAVLTAELATLKNERTAILHRMLNSETTTIKVVEEEEKPVKPRRVVKKRSKQKEASAYEVMTIMSELKTANSGTLNRKLGKWTSPAIAKLLEENKIRKTGGKGAGTSYEVVK